MNADTVTPVNGNHRATPCRPSDIAEVQKAANILIGQANRILRMANDLTPTVAAPAVLRALGAATSEAHAQLMGIEEVLVEYIRSSTEGPRFTPWESDLAEQFKPAKELVQLTRIDGATIPVEIRISPNY